MATTTPLTENLVLNLMERMITKHANTTELAIGDGLYRHGSCHGLRAKARVMPPAAASVSNSRALQEKSDDNLKLAAADPDLGAALGAMNAGAHPAGILPGASFQVRVMKG